MMIPRRPACLLMALALVMASSVSAQSPAEAAANWEAVVRCAQLPGKGARHDCLDALLRDKGLVDGKRELSEARQSYGQTQRADKPAPAPPRAPAAVAAKASSIAPATPPSLKRLDTTIASARLGPDRMLVLTTSEGAVWKQTQTAEIRFLPKRGDALEIEQGALGSHHCKIGSKVFRCQRAQ